MHESQSIHGAPNKMVEDARTALGNHFVGLRTQWRRMHERKSIHGLRIRFDGGGSTNNAWQLIRGAPDSKVEDV